MVSDAAIPAVRFGGVRVSVTSGRPAAVAQRARNSRAMRALARGGYVASGVLHVLIAWLAIQLAFGHLTSQADEKGALRAIAQMPAGEVLLWAIAIGFAALALWQLATAVVGVHGAAPENQTSERVKSAAKGVLYGALAFTTIRYTSGAGGDSGGEESLTARVLAMPGGQWLVGLAGAVIVGVGVYHVVKGARKKFLRDLETTGGGAVGPVVVRLGQAGYIAKGIALGIVGGLIVAAAVTSDAERAGGLDEALRTVRDQPFGPALLFVVGLGIAAYGVYSFARARFARL